MMAAEEKKQDGRAKNGGPRKNSGGRRPNAGRKPNYLKRTGVSPVSAHYLLSIVDQEKLVRRLLQSKSDDVVLRTLISLREMAYGKPKTAVELGGGIGVVSFSGNPALSSEELNARIRKLQEELGLVEPVIEHPQLPAPAVEKAESKPLPKPIPSPMVTSKLPQGSRQPSNIPRVNIPGQSTCDKHGPFTPKSKWEPSCPNCQYEWDQQNQEDRNRLTNLMPGEPAWRSR